MEWKDMQIHNTSAFSSPKVLANSLGLSVGYYSRQISKCTSKICHEYHGEI